MATSQEVLYLDTRKQTNRVSHWLALVFGCSHRKVSRPFTRQGETYRACLECGARRIFDLQNWQDRGSFQYADAQFIVAQ